MPGSSRAALLLHPEGASVRFGPNQTLGFGEEQASPSVRSGSRKERRWASPAPVDTRIVGFVHERRDLLGGLVEQRGDRGGDDQPDRQPELPGGVAELGQQLVRQP